MVMTGEMNKKRNLRLILNACISWCVCLLVIHFYFLLFVDRDDKIYWWGDPCILVLFGITSFYLIHLFCVKWLNRKKRKPIFNYVAFFTLWLMTAGITFGIYLEWISPRTGAIDLPELLYMEAIYMVSLIYLIIANYPIYLWIFITGFIILFSQKAFGKH